VQRIILSILAVAATARAGTFLQVTCNGNTTVSLGLSISCSDPDGAFANASGSGLGLALSGDNPNISSQYDPGYAQGFADSQQIVTISGGVGDAVLGFIPAGSGFAGERDFCLPNGNSVSCFFGGAVARLQADGQLVWDFESAQLQFGAFYPAFIPFTFGVPFTIDYHLSGYADAGSANIAFEGLGAATQVDFPAAGGPANSFWITDSGGDVLTTDFTVDAGPVTVTPEPVPAALVLFGMVVLMLWARFRERSFHGDSHPTEIEKHQIAAPQGRGRFA